MTTIGDRLRELREGAGLTLEQAGKIAGTTKQNTSQIEKGVTKEPGGILLYRWSRHYRVSLEWLITGKGERSIASQTARPDPEIVRQAHKLIAGAYEDGGKEFDIEAEPDLFAEVYERLASGVTSGELINIGRAIEKRQQGVVVDGTEGLERTGSTTKGTRKKRTAA